MRSHFKNKFKSAHISGLVHLFGGGGPKFSVKGSLSASRREGCFGTESAAIVPKINPCVTAE